MKKLIATIILAMIAQGVIAWRTVAVHDVKIIHNEETIKSVKNKVDDLHWYLIRSKGVKIEKGN